MATEDISRSAFDPRKHYASVRMQQGRVIVDADWNENECIENEDRRRTNADVIGPAGSPDDGFRIQNADVKGGQIDFDITAGTFYLGGLRLEIDQVTGGSPPKKGNQTYQTQTDWLQGPDEGMASPIASPTGERVDLVYLEAYQQPVSAVEDNELLEYALGGPDTSTRIHTRHRVQVQPDVPEFDCAQAWQTFKKDFEGQQRGVINDDHEVVRDTTLQVTFKPGGTPADLCTPQVSGGYLGAENQAIRVQLVDKDHLTWGFDNASPLYRVQLAADRETTTLITDPKDQAHWPKAGQAVEMLAWGAVLPNSEKMATSRGFLTKVQSSYNPNTRQLKLAAAVPTPGFDTWKSRPDSAKLAKSGEYYFMRVWDRGSDKTSDPAIPFTVGTALDLGHTGLRVTLKGTHLTPGDFWIIAARPETPNRVVPWDLEQGRPPHGVRRFYAPLALIHWTKQNGTIKADIYDCRPTFRPLTQHKAFCTLVAEPGLGWERIFDRIPTGADARVCFQIGEYLNQSEKPVTVQNRGFLEIVGCGPGTQVVAANAETALAFVGCRGITVRDLAAEARVTGFKSKTGHLNGVLSFTNCPRVTVEHVSLQCAAGTRRCATCLTVQNADPSAGDAGGNTQTHILHNELRIGHEQIGILVNNVSRVHIENNSLSVTSKPKSLTVEKMLRDKRMLSAAVKILTPDLVAFDIKKISITRSSRVAAAGDVMLATVPARLPTSMDSTTLGNNIKSLGLNAAFVAGDFVIGFRAADRTLAADIQSLLAAHTPDASVFASSTDLRRHVERVLSESLRHPERLFGELGRWYGTLKEQNPAVASQGIVVGGQMATDVRILNNTIYGVRQGIHVGQSRALAARTAGTIDRTERLQISGNTVTVLLPPLAVNERHGIFCGNCNSLVIENNYIVIKRFEATTLSKIDGIRVFGQIGRLMIIRQNHIVDPIVGVYFKPLNPKPDPRLCVWVIAENVSEGQHVADCCRIKYRSSQVASLTPNPVSQSQNRP